MNYLLICEIGPIYDFVRHSRKTKDYWAASFLFSYFMAEVAKKVKAAGAEVFLPFLDNNPMFAGRGVITCGSVPDQIYFLLNNATNEEIEEIREVLKEVVACIIDDLAPKISKAIKDKEKKAVSLSRYKGEINDFFNFFYVIHEIKDKEPKFIEAEREIRMRAAFKPFSKSTDTGINKWEKCNLCGDRQKIYERKIDKDNGLLATERICSVCLLKRYLPEAVKSIFSVYSDIEFEEPRYPSTSDIALIPIKECIDEEDKFSLKKLVSECKEETGEEIDISEGRYFYEPDFSSKFRSWREDIKKKYPEELKLNWLNRPFYAIVYMDGDNMGKILKKNAGVFNDYISKVSELLSEFSNGVNKIIRGYNGQLIFAGGEDINFVIHPEYLLDCICDLINFYHNLFNTEPHTKSMADMFTLSAGAVVCYHKYPLSEAIHRAGMMLKDHAKQYRDKNGKEKNATAISLIKGHTEALDLTFSNNLIGNLKELKECLIKSDISRTTPYRIEGHKELLGMIADEQLRKNFLYTIIAGTRNPKKEDEKIKEMVELLTSFGDMNTMISALLFARFLTGDRNA